MAGKGAKKEKGMCEHSFSLKLHFFFGQFFPREQYFYLSILTIYHSAKQQQNGWGRPRGAPQRRLRREKGEAGRSGQGPRRPFPSQIVRKAIRIGATVGQRRSVAEGAAPEQAHGRQGPHSAVRSPVRPTPSRGANPKRGSPDSPRFSRPCPATRPAAIA